METDGVDFQSWNITYFVLLGSSKNNRFFNKQIYVLKNTLPV